MPLRGAYTVCVPTYWASGPPHTTHSHRAKGGGVCGRGRRHGPPRRAASHGHGDGTGGGMGAGWRALRPGTRLSPRRATARARAAPPGGGWGGWGRGRLVLLAALLLELALLLGGGVLVLLVLGHEVVHVGLGLGELHLVHALAGVPVEEGL